MKSASQRFRAETQRLCDLCERGFWKRIGMNVYFCGMIGSGKTAIGRRIAEELGWSFHDVDEEMDRILGYSFHRLVQEKGWVAFRELEYSICKRFARLDRSVVALGGGTVRYEWNMDVLRGTGGIILLEASLETLVERVRQADRPRVNPGTSLEEDIQKIWETSREKYHAAADLVYRTDQKSIDEEVGELKEWIADRFGAGTPHGKLTCQRINPSHRLP